MMMRRPRRRLRDQSINRLIPNMCTVLALCAGLTAIRFAVEYGLPLAVRGGGHNVAGTAVVDGGLVIDLSAMCEVRIDSSRRTVHVQGGATWADVDNVTAPLGLATPGGVVSETGVAGLSIEDFTGDDANPLYDFDLAVARVRAARAAIDRAGGDVVFTARSEGFIKNRPDLAETIRRIKAFVDAGADCIYTPGIRTREQIEATVAAAAPKPVNFLNSGAFGFTVADLANMGVRRISVGGTLARVAMHAFIQSARAIANEGRFDSFAGVVSNAELNAFFDEFRSGRGS